MNKTEDNFAIKVIKSEVYELYEWTHNWIIEKFDKTVKEVFSESFESAVNTKWQMSVISRQLANGNRSFGINAQNLNHRTSLSQSMAKLIKCYVYVIDIYGKEVRIGCKQICVQNKITKLFEYEFNSIFSREFGFISGTGRLNLLFKFVIKGQKSDSIEKIDNSFKLIVDSIIPVVDPKSSRRSNTFITFFINDRKFYVNKTLISLNSTLFAQLFADNKHLDSFRLTDIKDEVFEDILHFINTRTVHNLKQNRIDLLIAANKYRFLELENLCVNSIGDDLTVDNVIKYLKLAKANQMEALVKKALLFIDKNYNRLKETKNWRQNFNFVLKVGQSFVSKN